MKLALLIVLTLAVVASFAPANPPCAPGYSRPAYQPPHEDYPAVVQYPTINVPMVVYQFLPAVTAPLAVPTGLIQPSAPAPTVANPATPPAPADGWPVAPTVPGAGSDLGTQATAILAARCAKCHSAPAGKGRLNLFQGSTLLTGVNWARVKERVERGEMPPDGPLSPVERQAVLAWAAGR